MPLSSVKGRFARRAWGVGSTLAPALAVAFALAIVTIGAVATAPAVQAASAQAPAASTPPAPARFVTDGAGFLSAATRDELEQRLARYEHDTGHQVLLWIGQTTGDEPIEPWAVRAFAAWRVGAKGLDDGVVVFILATDRRVRIEVGYGLEDRVPDAVASRIIGDQMIPRLRAGDRDGAARAGVSGVLAAVGGEIGAPQEAVPAPTAPTAPQEIGLGQLLVFGLIGILVLGFIVTNPRLALMLLTTIASNSGRGGGNWGGGGGGGGGFSGGGGRSGGGGASGSW